MTVNRSSVLLALCAGTLLLVACAGDDTGTRVDGPDDEQSAAAILTPENPPANTATSAPTTTGNTDATPSATEDTSMMAYQVGDTGPGGGIVFLVSTKPFPCGPDLSGQCNYLEAAPGASEVRRGWADVPRLELEVDGADATEIGSGWANTLDIIAQGNIDPVTSAAAYADAYEHNGYTDWYLPSRDEFKTLYEQRDIVGEFSGADYWSSSEVSPNMAWSHYFHQGHPLLPHPKNHYTHLIRPVRAF